MNASTVLITGVTGFLGSAIARELERDFRVIGLKKSTSSLKRLPQSTGIAFYDIDVTEPGEIFKSEKIDFIIHTAVQYGRKDEPPEVVLDANFNLPVRLASLAASSSAKAFLNTDTFYQKLPENCPTLRSYRRSKEQCRKQLNDLSSGLTVVHLQLEHLYGPRDRPEKFVPSMLQKLLSDQAIDLTPGEQKRDFIYLEDAVKAYRTVITSVIEQRAPLESGNTTLETGTGSTCSIRSFLSIAKELAGSKSELRFGALPYREGELMESQADTAKLQALGWKPSVDLREGISRVLRDLRKESNTLDQAS